MKLVTVYLPAVYLDAPQPGEYVSTGYATAIACVRCGTVQPLLRVDLVHACASPACAEVAWVELASGYDSSPANVVSPSGSSA